MYAAHHVRVFGWIPVTDFILPSDTYPPDQISSLIQKPFEVKQGSGDVCTYRRLARHCAVGQHLSAMINHYFSQETCKVSGKTYKPIQRYTLCLRTSTPHQVAPGPGTDQAAWRMAPLRNAQISSVSLFWCTPGRYAQHRCIHSPRNTAHPLSARPPLTRPKRVSATTSAPVLASSSWRWGIFVGIDASRCLQPKSS